MKLLLVGGNTGGPVAPLLAVGEVLRKMDPATKLLLVGTNGGVERAMAEDARVEFRYIVAGKFRRYFSIKNFFSFIFVAIGFLQSLLIIRRFKPDCAFGAGGYVQVPVLWAAWFSGVPVVIHQQDALPSLANRLCSPIARKITVTFEQSLKEFPEGLGLFFHKKRSKISLTGNPFRENLTSANKNEAIKFFQLEKDLPTLLVLGGGGGAEPLNKLIVASLPQLTAFSQIIHVTGKGKSKASQRKFYHAYEFLDRMDLAYAACDLVISRAGVSTITELSNLAKVAIIVPIPKSHQEKNAYLLGHHKAAIALPQESLTLAKLPKLVRGLLLDGAVQRILQENIKTIMPHNSSEKVAKVILELTKK